MDQDERKDGEESQLDEFPQDLLGGGDKFPHNLTPFGPNSIWRERYKRVGSLTPHPRVASIQDRPIERTRRSQSILRFENSQRINPSVISPTSPFDPKSLTKAMMLALTAPKNGKFAPTRSASTIASASSISASSVNAPTQPLMTSIPFIANSP